MELLVDVGHVESPFGPFGDSVSFGARQVHSLEIVLVSMHRMVLLGDEAQMEARFGPFRDSANLDSR
jgi:hypothetical protein